MRKLLFLMLVTLGLTGCMRIGNNLDDVVKATMYKDNLAVNTVSTGYELYIPIGVMQVVDNNYNQKFKIKDKYIYLYVDTVSYYYKNVLNYKMDNNYNYYYKKLQLGDKTGYIGVNKINDDSFFCEIVYNYSKVEFYSDLKDLPIIMSNSLIIQNSIKFNDNIIKLSLDSEVSDGRDIKYELDKPKDSESTFDKYLQEYVAEDTESTVDLPDEY